MHPTLEVRWFLPGDLPDAVATWFDELGEPAEEEHRTDRYLVPVESSELGVKVREGHVEAKQRTARADPARWGRAEAVPETWRKWSFEASGDPEPDEGWADVDKARRQRWLQFDGAVCALELSTVELAPVGLAVDGGAPETWWSVCLETSGERAADRARALHAAAARWLDREGAPSLPRDAAMGYPAWLRERAAAERPEGPATESGR